MPETDYGCDMRRFSLFLLLPLAAVLCSCGKKAVSLETVIRDMASPAALCRLDGRSTEIFTSFDRSGGENDYSNYAFPPTADGWQPLADFAGPGYLSRLWSTGIDPERVRIRLRFDGEETPRLEGTLREWTDPGLASSLPVPPSPVAKAFTNLCHYTFAPYPFQKSLRVEALVPDGKFYYQIQAERLAPGETIATFPGTYTPAEKAALEETARAWAAATGSRGDVPAPVSYWTDTSGSSFFRLERGETQDIFSCGAAGRIDELRFTFPDGTLSSPDATRRLRNLVLCARWDDETADSVRVPLLDLAGSCGRVTRFGALPFETAGETITLRFPMPFAKGACLRIENRAEEIDVAIGIDVTWLKRLPEGAGYFHAVWNQSGPAGGAHSVLDAKGHGRLAAVALEAVGADPRAGYWILESDETIERDGDGGRWHGTGLEDYFNFGWYYPFATVEPLWGVPCKIPFRTSQYRVHLTDHVSFDRSCTMRFERGAGDQTPGWFTSCAAYYLDRPAAARSRIPTGPIPIPRVRQVDALCFQHERWTAERFRDLAQRTAFTKARRAALSPDDPAITEEAALLDLENAQTPEAVDAIIARVPASKAVANAAEAMKARFAGSDLLHVYTSGDTTVFLDGKRVGTTASDNQPMWYAFPVPPEDGEHVVAVQFAEKPHPCTVAMSVETADGRLVTCAQGEVRRAYNLSGEEWKQADFDDGAWESCPKDSKGPPDDYDIVPVHPFPGTLMTGVPGLQPEELRGGGTGHLRWRYVR
jgi:hypothetical protein